MAALGKAGLTEVQHQQAIAAHYDAFGILSGCAVSGSPTAMTYNFTSGLVVVPVAAGRASEAIVAAGSVATSAAPSTGSRTDYIVANSDGLVSVQQTAPNATQTLLKRVIVPAGVSNTNAAQYTSDVLKAIPAGTSLGLLVDWVDQVASGVAATTAQFNWCAVTIPALSTRRLMQITIEQAIFASPDGATTASGEGGFEYTATLDGTVIASAELYYNRAWQPQQYTRNFAVNPGAARTLIVTRKWKWGTPGYHFNLGTNSGRVQITDLAKA